MRLPYVIFTLAMLASVSTAQAIPNMWTSGFGMGVTEYIITSPEKVVFNLNCTVLATRMRRIFCNTVLISPCLMEHQ